MGNAMIANTETFDAGFYITENYEFLKDLISSMTSLINISATAAVEREDLVQEGLLTLWEKKDTFDPSRGPFDRWASTVLYNRFIDIIRHDTFKKKTETHINDIADRLDEVSLKRQVSDSSNPEVFFDFYVALAEAFQNEKSRSVRIGLAGIWNSFTGRFTSDELAESLGINKVLLNSCISRARARFRPYLADYYS